MSQPLLQLSRLSKSYSVGTPVEVEVLHALDLVLEAGEFAALIGPAGSGKSTLLNLLGLLDRPTAGDLILLGRATRELSDADRTRLRGQKIGFVFQFHHLLSAFSATENVLMPIMAAQGRPTADDVAKAHALLDEVGLSAHRDKRPGQLSGGQQQRVAICRALINAPALLLADEPTGNLDTATSADVFELFRRFNRERELTVLVVTHDPRLSAQCDRVIELVDGDIASDRRQVASKGE